MPVPEDPKEDTRSRRFVSATLGTILTKFVLILLRLAMGVLTARLLGPSGRGLFFASLQTTGTVTTACGLSVGEGLIYQIGKREIASEQIFSAVLFLVLIFSALVLTLLALLMPIFTTYFLSELPEVYTHLLLILAPAMLTEYISFSALKGIKRFNLVNLLTIITRSNTLLCLFVGSVFWSPNLGVLLISLTIGSWINALVFFVVLFDISNRCFSLPIRQMLPTIRYGAAVHVGTLITEVEYRLDIFILLYFLNATAVGIYSIAVTLAQLLWYVSNSINTVLFPYLAETDKEDRDQLTVVVIKYSFYLTFVILVSLVICGMPLVTLLYGPLFADSYYLFLLLAPGILCDSVARNIAAWLKGSGQPLMLSWISAASLVINIALNIYLIPRFGMYGAAISSTGSYAVRAAVLLILFCYSNSISPLSLFRFTKSDQRRVCSVIGNFLNKRV